MPSQPRPQEISRPFRFEEQPLDLDPSIGIALFLKDAENMEALTDQAGRSMYQIKRSRKGK